MALNAVLFDMDGTLVDSIPAWHMTFNQALESQGSEPVSFKAFTTDILGQSTQQDISRYFPKLTVDELVGLYDRFFPANVGHIRPFPNTSDVLDLLDEIGLKKGIVTNTPSELMLLTLDRAGIADRFDILLGGTDVSLGKPDPEMIHKALELMGLGGDQAVLVGDTLADMDAGKNSGVATIGIGVPGDWSIDSLEGLPDVIGDIVNGELR